MNKYNQLEKTMKQSGGVYQYLENIRKDGYNDGYNDCQINLLKEYKKSNICNLVMSQIISCSIYLSIVCMRFISKRIRNKENINRETVAFDN